ncbi:MAG: rRNA maturation RNAse YbeY [Candidatus Liptonbacteria bacterium]|nr:rRNA maturation RNAse YbeY [Candidatus Liptonbacteria bacterium]
MRKVTHLLESRVRAAVRRALRAAGYPPDAAEVFFAGDREMRELKRVTAVVRLPASTHGARLPRGTARVVDVLAFEEPRGFPHPERAVFLGEVYVNVERYGNEPARLLALTVHGLAHLLGFRHEGRRDTIEMRRAEKALLENARAPLILHHGILIHHRARYWNRHYQGCRGGERARQARASSGAP